MTNPLVRGSVRFGDYSVRIGASGRPRTRSILAVDLSAIVRGWIARHRQRQDLGELSDRLLRDIGVSSGKAAREAAKWFWQK